MTLETWTYPKSTPSDLTAIGTKAGYTLQREMCNVKCDSSNVERRSSTHYA